MMHRRGALMLAVGVACTVFVGGVSVGWAAPVSFPQSYGTKYDVRLDREKYMYIYDTMYTICTSMASLSNIANEELIINGDPKIKREFGKLKQNALCLIDYTDLFKSDHTSFLLPAQNVYHYILGLYVRIPEKGKTNACLDHARSPIKAKFHDCLNFMRVAFMNDHNMAAYESQLKKQADRKKLYDYVMCYTNAIGKMVQQKKERQTDFDKVSASCRKQTKYTVVHPKQKPKPTNLPILKPISL